MSNRQLTCPECNYSCEAPSEALPSHCPLCDTPLARPREVAPPPTHLQPAPRQPAVEPVATPSPRTPALAVTIGVAVVMLLVAGGIYLFWRAMSAASVDPTGAQTSAKDGNPDGSHLEPVGEVPSGVHKDKADMSKGKAPPKPPPLTEEQKKINAAIDKGVNYLKLQLDIANKGKLPLKDISSHMGASNFDWQTVASHQSLMGLTLLECDVPASNPIVQQAAVGVRKAADSLTGTYALSLAIMFLDRLGDARDKELITIFSLRLIAGLTQGGNWDYVCRKLSDVEQSTLLDFMRTANYGVGEAAAITKNKAAAAGLPDAVKGLAVVRWCCGEKLPLGHGGNNSTTQFGLLGLWVAQRSGAPAHPALAMVAAHFRASQHDDGTWTYKVEEARYRYSMTCAGLLGLAVGRDLDVQLVPKKGAKTRDPEIDKGLKYVGASIADVRTHGDPTVPAPYIGKLYYFWCLERVGVIYNLKKIGGQDWYETASKQLLDTQKPDGHWELDWSGPPDTSFALLVLKRANVAPDLTKKLEIILDIKHMEEAPMP